MCLPSSFFNVQAMSPYCAMDFRQPQFGDGGNWLIFFHILFSLILDTMLMASLYPMLLSSLHKSTVHSYFLSHKATTKYFLLFFSLTQFYPNWVIALFRSSHLHISYQFGMVINSEPIILLGLSTISQSQSIFSQSSTTWQGKTLNNYTTSFLFRNGPSFSHP